MTKFWK